MEENSQQQGNSMMSPQGAQGSQLSNPVSAQTGLSVKSLSISIVPEPSFVVSCARTVKRALLSTLSHIPHKQFRPQNQLQHQQRRDLSQVGINVLRNVTMHVKPGQVCLILGASGAGKSTLLNSLASRMKWSQVAMEGDVRFNDQKAQTLWESTQLGFLYQDDHLEPYLTPRETLKFVAKLHSGSTRLTPEMHTKIEKLLAILGLKDCADRAIGSADVSHTSSTVNNTSRQSGSPSAARSAQHGISGGERRRVSVAMQLLTDPSFLFCDEPTSGLDAFASFELIKILTQLAKSENMTVVVSIHQPRSEIFQLLAENQGQLVLLSLGDVVYSGPVSGSLDWFSRQPDIPRYPKDVNPFDYLMDLCGVDHTSDVQEQASHERREYLVKAWSSAMTTRDQEHTAAQLTNQQYMLDGSLHVPSRPTRPASRPQWTPKTTVAHTIVLSHRGLLSQTRNKSWVVVYIVCYALIGLWTGAIFMKMNNSLLGIRARSVAFMIIANMCPLPCMAAMLYRLCHEARTFDRERKDRWYGPLPFVLSTIVKNIPLAFLGTTAYIIFLYPIINLRKDPESFWATIGAFIGYQFAVCAFPIPFGALFRDFVPASAMFFGIDSLFIMTSGTNIPFDKIPTGYVWTRYANFIGDTFKVLMSAEFTDREFDCPFDSAPGVRDPERCQWYNGNQFLDLNGGIKPHYYPGPIFILLAHALVYVVISWAIFTIRVVEPSAPADPNTSLAVMAKAIKAPFVSKGPKVSLQGPNNRLQSEKSRKKELRTDQVLEDSKMVPEDSDFTRIQVYGKTLESCNPVEVRVDNVSISTTAKTLTRSTESRAWPLRWFSSNTTTLVSKHLLKNVDLTFAPGELTAILGASGAGKTTLLNAIMHRSPAHLERRGDIWFNGSKNPSLRQINTVCGHVRQDDSFLHTHLTVRETLRYAAELSSHSAAKAGRSFAETWEKVEVIMELMGLCECADVLVGGPQITGCSGGQRRRLSIALQLILEPACLVLDEPTTGLDATSALGLIQTLKAIAKTGRTVICTIHQPRAAIWEEFDKVVVLMPGGLVGYAGKPEQVSEFFVQAGVERPEGINTPDFIIDSASVNFSTEETERETRQRVLNIATMFQEYRANAATWPVNSLDEKQGPTGSKNSIPIAGGGMLEPSQNQAPHFVPFIYAFPILARRMLRNESRQTALFFNRIFLGLMVGLLTSSIGVNMDWSLQGLMMRVFYINQQVLVSLTGVFAVLSLYPKQKQVAFHEVSSGYYGISAFLCSFIINAFPHELVVAAAVVGTNFVLLPIEKSWTSFGVFYLVILGYFSAGESIALLVSTWTSNECITIAFTLPFIILCGFTTPLFNSAIPMGMRRFGSTWIWSFGVKALALTQIADGVVEYAPSDKNQAGGMTAIRRGQDLLNYSRMKNLDLGECLAGLVAMMVFYRVMVWISLIVRVKREHW